MDKTINTTINQARITGKVVEELSFSHEIQGEKFYTTKIEIKRLSNNVDVIPVMIRERFYNQCITDTYIEVSGEYRSYNYIGEDGKSHLKLFLFAKNVEYDKPTQNENEIFLRGFISKPVNLRNTPFGRIISDICLAVNRNFRRSDYIPCIAWGANAYEVSDLIIGTEIEVTGRIQSREYVKGDEIKIAYEVSASKITVV